MQSLSLSDTAASGSTLDNTLVEGRTARRKSTLRCPLWSDSGGVLPVSEPCLVLGPCPGRCTVPGVGSSTGAAGVGAGDGTAPPLWAAAGQDSAARGSSPPPPPKPKPGLLMCPRRIAGLVQHGTRARSTHRCIITHPTRQAKQPSKAPAGGPGGRQVLPGPHGPAGRAACAGSLGREPPPHASPR